MTIYQGEVIMSFPKQALNKLVLRLPQRLPNAHGEPGEQAAPLAWGRSEKFSVCFWHKCTETDFYVLRLDFPLGLGCAGAAGHLCLLLLPCSFFQNTVGEEMQMYFWKLHSDQDIWNIFHPASTAAGFSHFHFISAPARSFSSAVTKLNLSLSPWCCCSHPGNQAGSGVNGCFQGRTAQPHQRGHAHVQLLGP